MMRITVMLLLGIGLLVMPGSAQQPQDPGQPWGQGIPGFPGFPGIPGIPGLPGQPGFPGQYAQAYVQNNTTQPIRYVVSSARGANTGTLLPGQYGQFYFTNEGWPRILCVYSLRTGQPISVREIAVQPFHVYTAAEFMIQPIDPVTGLPNPAAQGAAGAGKAGLPKLPKDTGKKIDPKTLGGKLVPAEKPDKK